jgi:hypothetical protein
LFLSYNCIIINISNETKTFFEREEKTMRVSKTMKEYIRQQVEAKIEPRIAEIQATIDEDMDAMRVALSDITEKAQAQVSEVLENSPIYCTDLYKNDIICFNMYQLRHPLQDEKTRLKGRIDEITQNIVVELELGGNKETLERLLSEIEV